MAEDKASPKPHGLTGTLNFQVLQRANAFLSGTPAPNTSSPALSFQGNKTATGYAYDITWPIQEQK